MQSLNYRGSVASASNGATLSHKQLQKGANANTNTNCNNMKVMNKDAEMQ